MEVADHIGGLGRAVEQFPQLVDASVNLAKEDENQLQLGLEEAYNKVDPGFSKLFHKDHLDACTDKLMTHEKRIYRAQRALSGLLKHTTADEKAEGILGNLDARGQAYLEMFDETCGEGQCQESLETILGSLNGHSGDLDGCDIPQLLSQRGEFDADTRVHDICNRNTIMRESALILNLVNNGLLVTSAHLTLEDPEQLENKSIFDDFYVADYKKALARVQEVSDQCLFERNGKAALQGQVKELMKEYASSGIAKTAEAIKDYVFRVHQDAFFDVEVFYKGQYTGGDAVGSANQVRVEEKNLTAVIFFIKRNANEQEAPAPLPDSKLTDAQTWVSSLITPKEVCDLDYERRFLVFKKTVTKCHTEYTPYASLRRAFNHQRHNAGLYCVSGLLAVQNNNTLHSWAGPRVQGINFEKGKMQLRVVLSPEACTDYAKNTQADEDGTPW